MASEINQAEITLLRFPENVRKRKEMYLIDPNHCIYEIIDNAVDEFNAGYAKNIEMVVRNSSNGFSTVVVKDDGRGIPTQMSSDPEHLEETQAEVALGNLTAGGKFGTDKGYHTITSGLHGVGASCVNATSEKFAAYIDHNETHTVLLYEKGILVSKDIEKPVPGSAVHGTTIEFVLDRELWKGENFDLSVIRRRLKQLTFLNPGLKISYSEYSVEGSEIVSEEYYHEDGLMDYFADITSSRTMLEEKPVRISKTVNDPELGDIAVDVVFCYSTSYTSDIYGFVNSVSTAAGDHYKGFNMGVNRAVTSFFSESDKYKNLVKNLVIDDTKEGLCAIVSVKVMYPKFEGQSKQSIKMPQVGSAVNSMVREEFKFFLERHPSFAKALADKLEKAYKGRQAAKRARDAARGMKNALDSSLPGKLSACSSKKPEECSLYIVEGDSAAGSAIQGRDSRTQAILPVFGKVLNTEKSRPEEAISNGKLLDVVKALKCGIGKDFDIKKLRYHKIIIMADADVDGAHISTLWITFFYRYMPELVLGGHLYIALSPIYRVAETIGKREVYHYFFNDDELAAFKTKNKIHVSYIKGLGELQPKQLWESTMDPENRRLIRVTADDAEMASYAIAKCMGTNVDIRRQFILDNADFDKVLD